MDTPVIMDLGDFNAEHTLLKLKINGNAYEIEYAEATVDEVFHMMSARDAADTRELVERRRQELADFYCKHLKAGDPEQLRRDLATVPFRREGAPFDIERLYLPLVMRVKKNESGVSRESA